MSKNNFLFILFLYAFTSTAQTSSSVQINSRAMVVNPIEITKSVDLDFGNVISAINSGSVTLAPDGTRTANGVNISNSFPGNVAPAEALVNHGNNKYSITLPESFILYNQEDPNQVLILNNFKVHPITGELIDVLKIGGTLNLKAYQPSGIYTNTTGFNVTVSYN